MIDYLSVFRAKAFMTIPGKDYNRVFYDLRQDLGGSAIIYEIVLNEKHTWDYLRDKIYPNIARYLKEKGVDPSDGSGFVVALFFKDFVYFIRGWDFITAFCEIEGLNLAAFHFRVLKWLSG